MSIRDTLPEQSRGYPAIGAVHEVIADKNLRDALGKVADIADDVFDAPTPGDTRSLEERIADGDKYNPSHYYRLFDAQTLGLSVFEMDLSEKVSRRARTVWEGQDLGAFKQDVENFAAKHSPDAPLQISCKGIMMVGGRLPLGGRDLIRTKLAFLPDPTEYDETIELLNLEHQVIKATIERRLGKRNGGRWPTLLPLVDFVPHVTFLAYKQHKATAEQIRRVNTELEELLREEPITLSLGRFTTNRSRLIQPH